MPQEEARFADLRAAQDSQQPWVRLQKSMVRTLLKTSMQATSRHASCP